jgi:hypothetical protein
MGGPTISETRASSNRRSNRSRTIELNNRIEQATGAPGVESTGVKSPSIITTLAMPLIVAGQSQEWAILSMGMNVAEEWDGW